MGRRAKVLDEMLRKVPKENLKKHLTTDERSDVWRQIVHGMDDRMDDPQAARRQWAEQRELRPQERQHRSAATSRADGKRQQVMGFGAAAATILIVGGLLVSWHESWLPGFRSIGTATGRGPSVQPMKSGGAKETAANPSTQQVTNKHQTSAGSVAASNLFRNATDFHMLSTRFGWIIDRNGTKNPDQVIVTSDGDRNWTNVTPAAMQSNSGKTAYSGGALAQFVSAKVGFVATSLVYVNKANFNANEYKPTVFVTHDGGVKWSQAELPGSGTTYGPVTMDFVNRNVGFVVTASINNGGEGGFMDKRIYRTVDGGQHWTLMSDIGKRQNYNTALQPGSVNAAKSFGWIKFVNQNLGFTQEYVVSGTGADTTSSNVTHLKLARTTDGGKTWHPVTVKWPTYPPEFPAVVNEQMIPVQVLPNGPLVLDGIQVLGPAVTQGNESSGNSSSGGGPSGTQTSQNNNQSGGGAQIIFFESKDGGKHFTKVSSWRSNAIGESGAIIQGGYFNDHMWWLWSSGHLLFTKSIQTSSTIHSQETGSIPFTLPPFQGGHAQNPDVNPSIYVPNSRVSFVNAKDGYLLSSQGKFVGLWTTNDGGSTWRQAPVPMIHNGS